MIKPIKIWYYVIDAGDGNAYPAWFLTEEDCEIKYERDSDFSECCSGEITTIEGTDEHLEAIANSWELHNDPDGEFEVVVNRDSFEVTRFTDFNKARKFADETGGRWF